MLIGAAPEVSSLEDEDFKSGIFTHFLKRHLTAGVQEENQEEYTSQKKIFLDISKTGSSNTMNFVGKKQN